MIETHGRRTSAVALVLASLAMVLTGVMSAQPALAAPATDPPAVELSLTPVEQTEPYFDLTMEPGETRQLAVELGNDGTTAIEAFTFAADAYTVANGGFGAKERGSVPAGTTTWLSYSPGVVELPNGQGVTRDFSVTVPPGTGPGQYLTSIVLENNVAVEGSGDVAFDQIIRQAVAVSIDVPGAAAPALEVGAATHTVAAGRSVVDVAVSNTGNAHLRPSGTMTIRDSAGSTVSTVPVTMDAFYARTDSRISSPLDGTLDPGDYTVSVVLTDTATGARADREEIPFTVAAPTTAAATTETQANPMPQILQDAQSGFTPFLIAAGALLMLVILVLVIRRRREAPIAG